MSESLIDIVQNLVDEEEAERKDRFQNNVFARLHGVFNKESKTYWLCNDSRNDAMFRYPNLKRFGEYISKNSNIAVLMLNKELGETIKYSVINNLKRNQQNEIVVTSRSELANKRIELLGDSQIYSYDSLGYFLQELLRKRQAIEENERIVREKQEQKKRELDAHKRGIITREINKMLEEKRILTLQQEALGNLTKYIREQGKLRYSPILDPVQNRIKTSNLYDGNSIIIDGGPGTGKTTTMIQRLKYLTDDYAIKEDADCDYGRYRLTAQQRQHLLESIDAGRDWVFFSPSVLLKEFLAEAMNKEGLTNTKEKVWSWGEYLKKVIRDYYHFINPISENSPFLASKNEEPIFNQQSDVINDWLEFYLEFYRNIKTQIPTINDINIPYKWKSIAISIRQRFENVDNYDLDQFVRLFLSLENVYGDNCRELLSENRNIVKKVSEEVYVLIESENNHIIKEKLQEMVSGNNSEQTEDVDDEPDDQDETMGRIIALIRTWFRRYCYSTKNKEIKLTARQNGLSELLFPLLLKEHKDVIDRVGELVLFEQFAKYTRGVSANMLSGLPAKYKRFRRKMALSENDGWNQELLKELLQRRGGKELHLQEQALLVGFVNNLVKRVLKYSNKKINHYYIDAYQELKRPIIGIDEATDFSKCDIYAMVSLLSMDYNSLTLCGDLMQRLTKSGLSSWKDLEGIVPNMMIVNMFTSYRQSTRLLDMAKLLYRDAMGAFPAYKAYFKSKRVPVPLAFISNNEQEKIDWIEQRIKEIYSIYKRLPVIAVFLNKKEDIPAFVSSFENCSFINDNAIEVIDGSSGRLLASGDHIRVYPISVVKGMEFDVAFFHNIDDSQYGADLTRRHLYVGVSRAAFFLGITCNTNKEELIQYFDTDKDWRTMFSATESTNIQQNDDNTHHTTLNQLPLFNGSGEDRRGSYWTNQEDAYILKCFNQNYKIEDIAHSVGRTEVAIKMRLAKLGVIEYKYGDSCYRIIQKTKPQ